MGRFATAAAYGADLVAAGAATHFVLREHVPPLLAKLAAAAACPPPHTARGMVGACRQRQT
jgi:hypothetical protein